MSQQPLQQNKQYLNFINSLHSEATKTSYRRALQYYMKYIKTNTISTLISTDTKAIEDQIITYLVYMRDQKLSYPTKNQRLSALKKFYDMNDVLLNWRKINQYLGENTRRFKDGCYTTEEIQQLLTKADERMRVLITVRVEHSKDLQWLVDSVY